MAEITLDYQIQDIELYNNKGQQLTFNTDDINSLHIEFSVSESTEEDGCIMTLLMYNNFEMYEFYTEGMKQTINLYYADNPSYVTLYQCDVENRVISDNEHTQDIAFSYEGKLSVNNSLSKVIPGKYVNNNSITSLQELITLVKSRLMVEIITTIKDFETVIYTKNKTYWDVIQEMFPGFRIVLYGNQLYIFDKMSDVIPMVEVLEIPYEVFKKVEIKTQDLSEDADDEYDDSYIEVDFDDIDMDEIDLATSEEQDENSYIYVWDEGGNLSTVYGRIYTEGPMFPGVKMGSVVRIVFDIETQDKYNHARIADLNTLFIVTSQTTYFTWREGAHQTLYLMHLDTYKGRQGGTLT